MVQQADVLKYVSCVLTLLVLSSFVQAADTPSASSQLKQIPDSPAAPASPEPQLTNARARSDGEMTAGATLVVQALTFSGATRFSAPELVAVAGFTPGSTLSLAALRDFAIAITNHYHAHGYFLAQAHVPAQDIVDGAVMITVVEGEYGKVVLRNQSPLSDGLAYRLLDGIDPGDPISMAPLETRLLLLSDLHGVKVKSTLVPGASVGASDLIVEVTPGKRLDGSIDVDNSGSRYTGELRTGGTLNLNNPFGRGDVATLRAFTSWRGLDYGRASYQQQFGRGDAGVAYSAMNYELGREFASLQAHGSARIASLYGRYPLLRSRSNSLYAQFNGDSKRFHDLLDVTAIPTRADKKAHVAILSLVGDQRDRLGGGGVSSYSLTWTSGSLDLEDAQVRAADAATARSNGHYDKLGLSVMRLQRLTHTLSLYVTVQGQMAMQNLDVSEKLELGGVNAVRAYAEGDAFVDHGALATLELRVALPDVGDLLPGQLQLIGFLDGATGRLNKTAWSAGSNRRTLAGGGVGVNWFHVRQFVIKASYAHTLGNDELTLAPVNTSRFWINAVKFF
jgi:hemolysin activation/secretion protein